MAEHVRDAKPDGLQQLFARAAWDADVVRDHLRGDACDPLGSQGTVLIVGETGDLKKGPMPSA
ncbi:transposase [Amycolatopsis granulosa]|uniref:transposase n=1 Tax=Amycolatopsis granulosa TaxID=185684 RepID=UPI00141D919A